MAIWCICFISFLILCFGIWICSSAVMECLWMVALNLTLRVMWMAIFVTFFLLGLEESLSWQKVNSMNCSAWCEVGFIGGWLSLCAPIYIKYLVYVKYGMCMVLGGMCNWVTNRGPWYLVVCCCVVMCLWVCRIFCVCLIVVCVVYHLVVSCYSKAYIYWSEHWDSRYGHVSISFLEFSV